MQQKKERQRLTYDQMRNLAISLCRECTPPFLILLKGGLGAGKTTFARFFIQEFMGQACDVPSPTFTLVQVYESPRGAIHHYDLYRLKQGRDVIELGFEDSLKEAITLVEWPEIIEDIVVPPYLRMTFTIVSEIEREVIYELYE